MSGVVPPANTALVRTEQRLSVRVQGYFAKLSSAQNFKPPSVIARYKSG
jgi:hypothetical protein